MPTDEELIDEIQLGSQAAMEVLVKRHYQYIFAYVYRKVGDYHLAYDLTQEVFVKMMKALKRYRGKNKFKHWLLKIAVNHCRDYFRSRAFKHKEKEGELAPKLIDQKSNVWDLISKKINSEEVKAALEQLPEYQKETIILRYYHDLKIKEIAEVTDSKEATVKSRLRQGQAKLKQLLGEVISDDVQQGK
ncbi:MAG TPA: RNA polymerase sigma factor [Bacilli bacterium]|nr:RNA polymerase sigma factor [Bacilli bacterium]